MRQRRSSSSTFVSLTIIIITIAVLLLVAPSPPGGSNLFISPVHSRRSNSAQQQQQQQQHTRYEDTIGRNTENIIDDDDDGDMYGHTHHTYSTFLQSVNQVVEAFRQPIVQRAMRSMIPGASNFLSLGESMQQQQQQQQQQQKQSDNNEFSSLSNLIFGRDAESSSLGESDDFPSVNQPYQSGGRAVRQQQQQHNFLEHQDHERNDQGNDLLVVVDNDIDHQYDAFNYDAPYANYDIVTSCAQNSSGIYASFLNRTFTCQGMPVTEEEYNRQILIDPLNNNCTKSEVRQFVCFCPLDRVGEGCATRRAFHCEPQLVSPQRQCQLPGSNAHNRYGGIVLDGDFPCLWYTMRDTVQFTYNLTCQFTEQSSLETMHANLPRNATYRVYATDGNYTNMSWDEIQSQFTYFLNHNYTEWINGTVPVTVGTFALTRRLGVPLVLKAYNFNSLSDESGVHGVHLSRPGHYIGVETVSFSVNFTRMSEEMFAGDRLYMDLRMHKRITGLSMPWEKVFIDFTDRRPPVYKNVRTIVLASVLPTVGTGALILLTIIVLLYYRKQHRERKEIKSY